MASIRCEDLTYTYGIGTPFVHTAVSSVNVSIDSGEFVGLIGHTGSGKSTLIQHLNGLLRPTSGRVLIDGEDIWAKPSEIRKVRFKVGLVFQYPEYQLFEETVFKDIAFGPTNMGLSKDEIEKRVHEAIRFVGLDENILQKSPFELSGGQKRRVAIAGVMAMEPEILVLDEPTAGLDPKGRDEILSRIRDYHRERKTTVILVSHSMEDVPRHSTKVLVMNRSQVAMYGPVDEVFRRAGELEEMGLSIPQITKVFIGLRKRGYPVNTAIYTVHQATEEILRLKGGVPVC